MLNLKITIDELSGFCFGVVYAVEMAESILEEHNHLYCLGDIVHNDEEVKRLEEKGLIIINYNQFALLRNEKVLIRAHGEPPSTYKMALDNNIELIDASCPVVLKLQNRIKNSHDKKEKILIYGKHGHAEVLGLLGQTNNEASVFQDIDELDFNKLPSKVILYSQTTKSTEKFYEIKDKLSNAGFEVETNDTICRQVSNRDVALKKFAAKFDKIIFVSGSKSSNGKVLFQVCKDTNVNTFFVSNIKEINKDWFSVNESVGICGATSTPMWLMEAVKNEMQEY